MPISKPHSSMGASNNGSCSKLAFYLEKENRDLDKLLIDSTPITEVVEIEKRKQLFFSSKKNNISTNQVIDSIDNNIKKLGKKDSKYFAPTISFSQLELEHVVFLTTKRKDVKDIWDLNNEEFLKFNALLQDYVRLVMTNYASNFNRQDKSLTTGKDLVYYAKIEHFRRYKGTDEAVIKGLRKAETTKPGLNSHAHIIVSRKDKTQRLKLTPTTKERNTDRVVGNNKYRVGFDRMKWTIMNENSFDSFFKYQRKEIEKFKNQYILKNGSQKEKEALIKAINQQKTKQTKNYVKSNTNSIK